MSLKLVLLCCFVALSAGEQLPRQTGDAANAELGQIPYLVTLCYNNQSLADPIIIGSGVILNEQWILTLGHYRMFAPSPDEITVIAANIHRRVRSEFEQIVNVSSAFFQEDFPGYEDGTVALLKLETPLKFNEYVKPIDLPQPNSRPHGSGVLAGLGLIATQPSISIQPDTLQAVTMPIISQDECRKLYDATDKPVMQTFDDDDDDNVFCTGPEEISIGYCLDLSYNPFVTEENGKKVVSGIAIFAFTSDCFTTSTPCAYINVAPAVAWIRQVMSTK